MSMLSSSACTHTQTNTIRTIIIIVSNHEHVCMYIAVAFARLVQLAHMSTPHARHMYIHVNLHAHDTHLSPACFFGVVRKPPNLDLKC